MVLHIVRIFFYINLGLFFYILFGHGIVLAILRLFFSRPTKREYYHPDVTFIIPAYNEEKHIEDKVKNTLALNYPKDKLKIVIVSDKSTDKTDEIIEKYCVNHDNLILLKQDPRQGRTIAINRAAREYPCEVFGVSDANVMLDKDALKEIVANFADPAVGCVTAKFVALPDPENPVDLGLGAYWHYEQFIRNTESRIGSIPFISGCFNAVRGGLLVDAPADITHDHYVPADLAQKGYRTIYDGRSVVYEMPAPTAWKESEIRGRNFLMGVNFLKKLSEILDIKRHPFFFTNMLFHKILRYFTPFYMVFAIIASIFLTNEIIPLIFLGMNVIGILITLIMHLFKNPISIISTIGFFYLAQLGLMGGVLRFLFGKRIVTWQPPR